MAAGASTRRSVATAAFRRYPGVAALVLSITASAVFAQEPDGNMRGETHSELSGSVALELRAFQRSPAAPGQSDAALHPGLIVAPDYLYEWNGGDDRIDVKPRLRADAQDSGRPPMDFHELRWLHLGARHEWVIGADRVFWGVTESRHLVDIVNQADVAADIDGEDKLGQPMIALKALRDWGDLDLFVMPYFRDRRFPGKAGRLRGEKVVAADRARFAHRWKRHHPDLAVRASAVAGPFDIGLSHFHGTSREAVLRYDGAIDRLVPFYDIIDQTGIDAQATLGDWLLKLESIHRTGHGRGFTALTAGLEYTLYGRFDDGRGDIGLLAEYHYDGRGDRAPPTPFDNDVFSGVRFSFNDTQDTRLLAGMLIDHETRSHAVSAEFETRIGAFWSIAVDGRLYGGADPDDPLFGARRDNHLQMAFYRYF